MEKDKKNNEEIDEQYLISMMAGGVRKQGMDPQEDAPAQPREEKTEAKVKPRAKKSADTDYEAIFFKNTEGNARYGKSAYLRPEFHERISRIVQVIGEDKISFYAYLDNVLDYHFKEFGEEITKSFNDKYKPIL
jgi:hypothetical protein